MKQADFTRLSDHPRPKFLAPAGILSRGRSPRRNCYCRSAYFRGAGHSRQTLTNYWDTCRGERPLCTQTTARDLQCREAPPAIRTAVVFSQPPLLRLSARYCRGHLDGKISFTVSASSTRSDSELPSSRAHQKSASMVSCFKAH
jgi:hypothetical protein